MDRIRGGRGVFAITTIGPKRTPRSQGTAIAFELDDMYVTVNKIEKSAVKFWTAETPVCWTAIVYDPDATKSSSTNAKLASHVRSC